MIDIWGRPISSAEKPTTKMQGLEDVKKIIEDEIAETLNLASVNPEEIVVFQDKQGKLKSSDVSIKDILIRRREAAVDNNKIVLFDEHGKIKPGVLMSTITDKLTTVDNTATSLKTINDEYKTHVDAYTIFSENQKTIIDKIDKSLIGFFGNPPVTEPKLADIKTAIDKLTKLKTEYDAHISKFETLKKNFNSIDEGIIKFFGKKHIKPDDVKTSLDEIDVKLKEIALLDTKLGTVNTDITAMKNLLGVIRESRSISDLITINKKSIEDLKKSVDESKTTM
jgi:hypothetical protein